MAYAVAASLPEKPGEVNKIKKFFKKVSLYWLIWNNRIVLIKDQSSFKLLLDWLHQTFRVSDFLTSCSVPLVQQSCNFAPSPSHPGFAFYKNSNISAQTHLFIDWYEILFNTTKCCEVIITRKWREHTRVCSVIENNYPSSWRIFTFHFFFFDSHFGKWWKDNSFSLDDFEWQRGTQQWLTIADPSHHFMFQDGGHIPPVTSPRAACKRSIAGKMPQ